jgi:hypothetical protein
MTNVNALLHDHVTLEVECIDRLYLNGFTKLKFRKRQKAEE